MLSKIKTADKMIPNISGFIKTTDYNTYIEISILAGLNDKSALNTKTKEIENKILDTNYLATKDALNVTPTGFEQKIPDITSVAT